MANELYNRLLRVKGVEVEFRAASLAAARLIAAVSAGGVNPAAEQLRARDVTCTAERLEATYHLRLYAEFESAVREAWRVVYRRHTRPLMEVLVDRVGAIAGVPGELILETHNVREHRNRLIHDSGAAGAVIRLDRARHTLCDYLSRLSRDWL